MTPRSMLIGITHNTDLTPIIRDVKVLKVGIGVPKGRASYIYTFRGEWIARFGAWEEKNDKKTLIMKSAKFKTREAIEEWYAANKLTFAVSNRPQKIPFFTFTRRTMIETNGKPEEVFEPDFAAIEAHGDTPREIDIVFMGDNPLFGQYQAWSASELKCSGDGLVAQRVVQLGNDKWPGWKESVEAKQKTFPVSECAVSGLCPYAQEGGKDKLVCKPNATLTFQLANSIRLGATAYFTTTSIRSTQNLFSSLAIIHGIADRAGASIANTPMKLVLAPFRTNHNGIAATQYGVSLELRAEDAQKLRLLLAESAWKAAPPRMINAVDEEAPQISASAVTAEFYPEAEFDDEEPTATTAETQTANKTEALAEKLTAPAAAPAAPPAEVPGLTQKDIDWQNRIRQAYLVELGESEFKAVIHSVTGVSDIVSITLANHKAVYDAMVKAKQKAEEKDAVGTSKELF